MILNIYYDTSREVAANGLSDMLRFLDQVPLHNARLEIAPERYIILLTVLGLCFALSPYCWKIIM